MITEPKSYLLPGDPIALARARFSPGRFYHSQREFKMIAAVIIRNQHDTDKMFNGPVHMSIRFFMPKPKSFKRKIVYWHHIKPDIDNLQKMLLDILNGIVFNDDSCVSSINCIKVYDDKPRTEFTIQQLLSTKE